MTLMSMLEYSDSQPRDERGMWAAEGHAHVRAGQSHRSVGDHSKAADEFTKASEKYAKAGMPMESKTTADMAKRMKVQAGNDRAKSIRRYA